MYKVLCEHLHDSNQSENEHTCTTTNIQQKKACSHHHHTCNHVIHRAHFEQHLLDEAHLGACLQVSNTFSKDGGEHAPDFGLAGDVTVLQQLHHAADAFRILDNEVCLQIKLTTHQLQNKMRQIGNVRKDWIFMPAVLIIFCALFM